MNSKGFGRKRAWHNQGICLEWLGWTTRNVRQDSPCPGRASKTASPKYESRVLPWREFARRSFNVVTVFSLASKNQDKEDIEKEVLRERSFGPKWDELIMRRTNTDIAGNLTVCIHLAGLVARLMGWFVYCYQRQFSCLGYRIICFVDDELQRRLSWPNLCFEGPRKTVKEFRHNNLPRGPDLNPGSPVYKVAVLTARLLGSTCNTWRK